MIYLQKHVSEIFDLKEITIAYCINDVVLTRLVLINVIKIINEERVGLLRNCFSAASVSHKLFFRKYNIKRIPQGMLKENDVFARKAYFGGRCEVFGNLRSGEKVKYYDFSGMYGQCMLEKFHNGEGKYYIGGDYNIPGFHTIEYESCCEFLPVLPRHSSQGKLLFTNGRGVGTFWFEEIQLFVKMGGLVLATKCSYVYDKYEEVFIDFVNKFTELRKRGGYYKVFGKLTINSLYGSMALRADDTLSHVVFSEEEFLSV